MLQFITSAVSACLLLYVAPLLTGRWANLVRIMLVVAGVANAILAAQHLPARLS